MARDFEDHCWKDVITPDMLKIYKNYERDLYIGARPALVLVDLYNCVFEGGNRPLAEIIEEYPNACGEYAWSAIPPILSLIAASRQAGIPIVHVTAETRDQTDVNAGRPTKRRKRSVSPDAFEIKDDFRPQAGDVIVYKRRASGFFGSLLASHLVKLGVDCVIVAGETTSGCVRGTAVDSHSHGFHTVVVEECCFDRSLLVHKINLFDIHHKWADVMHLDEVLSHLQKTSLTKAA